MKILGSYELIYPKINSSGQILGKWGSSQDQKQSYEE